MSTQNLARDAFDAFYSGSHDRCGQLLGQVNSTKSGSSYDVKVQHNTLLNDYYKSGCCDPQSLLNQLTQAYERHRERNKEKDSSRAKKRDDEDDDTSREDEELTVLRYNQALVCLQLRHYAQAALILEDLFVNIEPIDDFLAIKICFLLLELCLLQREPEQAVGVLAYLEKPNAFLTVMRSKVESRAAGEEAERFADAAKACEDGADALGDEVIAEFRTPVVAKKATVTAAEEVPEGPLPSLTLGAFVPRHGRPPDTISRAEYRFFCLMYRARLSVALKNTKAAKKDVKNALEVLDQDLRHAPLLTSHPHTTGAGKKDKDRLSQLALQDALQHQHSAMVLTMKAYLEYTKQNVRKSIKLLTLCQFNFAEGKGSSDESRAQRLRGGEDGDDDALPTDFHPAMDEATASVFFNNVGCVHFLMRKPNLAAFYFQKALHANIRPVPPVGKSNGQSLALGAKNGLTLPGVLATKHWLDRKAELSYNAALQMLMCERPVHAFKLFEPCIPILRTWPRLWLRLAECCVEMHRQALKPMPGGQAGEAGNNESVPSAASVWTLDAASPVHAGSSSSSLVWGVHGSGPNRRWLLTTAQSPGMGKAVDEEDGNGKPAAAASPPLKRAIGGGLVGEKDSPFIDAESAMTHAVMCLRNVLALVMPLLADRAVGASAAGAGSGSLEGLSKLTPGAGASGSAAPAASANGDKAVAGAVAAGQKPSKPVNPGSSSRHQARDVLESEASLLEDAALVKLSYVCLCQHDPASALKHSRRLLEKNCLLVPKASDAPKDGAQNSKAGDTKALWTFQAQHLPSGVAGSSSAVVKHPSSMGCVTLAVMYLVEALLASGKTLEARTLLSSFVPAAADGDQSHGGDAAADAGLQSPTGLTPPWHCSSAAGSSAQKDNEGKAGEEKASSPKDTISVMFPGTELPQPGDTQCMLYANLASLHAQDGNFDEAERCCELAMRLQPRALAPLRTLVYIFIRRGKHAQALELLRQKRM